METILCLPQRNRLVRVLTHMALPDIDVEQLMFNRHVLGEYVKEMLQLEEPPLLSGPPTYFTPDTQLSFHRFNELLCDLDIKVRLLVYTQSNDSLTVDVILGPVKGSPSSKMLYN